MANAAAPTTPRPCDLTGQRARLPGMNAWPIVFPCSPGANFIRGTAIDVNGSACMR